MSKRMVYTGLKATRVLRSPTMNNTREYLTYCVELDATDIEAMAIKAAGNKSGRSKMGPCTVTITSAKIQ